MCLAGLPQSCLTGSCDSTNQEEAELSPTLVKTETTETEETDERSSALRGSRGSRGRSRSRRTGSDSQSAGRKIAAKLYPLDTEAPCEWQGKGNCGGGDHPILGCLEGKQQARHHGPDKDVANNDSGNVHRICHYCGHNSMRILTSDLQWIELGELSIGQELIGFHEDIKRIDKPRLIRSYVKDLQVVKEPSYKFYMSDGTELISSHNHQWVGSPSGRLHPQWRTTESLLKNPTHPSSKYTLRKILDTWNYEHTYEMGYLAAMLDGEGCLSENQLSFSQKEGFIYDYTTELMFQKASIDPNFHEEERPSDNYKSINVCRVTNLKDIASILGSCRPKRLLEENWPKYLDRQPQMKGKAVTIEETEYLGIIEVVSLQTTSKTMIMEGYASHNCHYRWHAKNDPNYNWNAGVYPAHTPSPLTPEELKIQALDQMRYHATKRKKMKVED